MKPGKNSTEPKRDAQTIMAYKLSRMPASCFMTLWKENRQQISCRRVSSQHSGFPDPEQQRLHRSDVSPVSIRLAPDKSGRRGLMRILNVATPIIHSIKKKNTRNINSVLRCLDWSRTAKAMSTLSKDWTCVITSVFPQFAVWVTVSVERVSTTLSMN